MPKQTLQQFGASIKAKHPEYRDMDDAALGKSVLAKYPQYGDMVEQSPAAPPPSMLQQGMSALGNFGKGIAKSGISLMSTGDEQVRKIPGIGEWLTTPANGTPADKAIAHTHQMATPHGTPQNLGYGIGEAAQFLIPGGAEEAGAAKLASLAPRLGRAAAPLARMATSALSSGAVNAAQGGSPGTGALMGAGGSAVGQTLAAVAPHAVELAQGIKNAGGRTGKAILDETSGILPNSIRASAKETTNQIGSDLGDVMRNASQRPMEPVRGLLQAPEYEVPLAPTPNPRNPRMRPMSFDAKVNPEEPWEPRSGDDMAPISEYPGVNPQYMSGSAHPELSGRVPTTQGNLLTRDPTIHGQAEPPAPEIPYRGISLSPFRDMAQNAIGDANLKGDVKLAKGVGRVNENTLLNRGLDGERPETVSPYEFWKTKQGVGDAVSATKWRPGYKDKFSDVQKRIYGSMADTLHNEVPESVPLDSRYSNLIDATKPAERSLWGHAAGPLAGTLIGGTEGYNQGGPVGAVKGALLGAGAGIAGPTLLNAGSRFVYNPATQRLLLPAATGAALQLTDRKDQQ
jgi:hypothetical protein